MWVFNEQFGIGEQRFGLIWGLMALTYVAGAILNGRLAKEFGVTAVMRVSIVLVVLGGWLAWAMVAWSGMSVFNLLLPMGLLMAVAGSVSPGALAGAVNLFPNITDTNSNLSNTLNIIIKKLFTITKRYIYQNNYTPIT